MNDKPTLFGWYSRSRRAPEDPRDICLSEPLAPIMKFPIRVKNKLVLTQSKRFVTIKTVEIISEIHIIKKSIT